MKTSAMLAGEVNGMVSILGAFRRDARGLAAVEFVLILPIALALFTGAIIYGDEIAIDRKVTLTTHTVTDLVTQVPSVAQADLQTLMGASSAIMAPYSAANVIVKVSQVQVNSAGVATISWSQSLPVGNSRTPGQTVSLPSTITTPGAYYIWGEVSYNYTPTIGYMLTGSKTLSDQTYMSPRVSTAVTCSDCP
jgi:Flp pilus assembly protein TadG